jgi:hypothetical protein
VFDNNLDREKVTKDSENLLKLVQDEETEKFPLHFCINFSYDLPNQ